MKILLSTFLIFLACNYTFCKEKSSNYIFYDWCGNIGGFRVDLTGYSDFSQTYTFTAPSLINPTVMGETQVINNIIVNFGDGAILSNIAPGSTFTHVYTVAGDTSVKLSVYTQGDGVCETVLPISIKICNPGFSPTVNSRYWLSAWVKENSATIPITYTKANLKVNYLSATSTVLGTITFVPTGEIIDGWQRIVGDFVIPASTATISLNLANTDPSIEAYFDDVRIHPFNASMKSYVYDPLTLLLTAELDDNNYATIYEYDPEGQLIRIKKETERGVMTIQESRSSNPKVD